MAAYHCFGKVNVVAGIHAVQRHKEHLYVAVPNSRPVLLNSDGERPRHLPCVVTGTVLALGSVDGRRLLT